MLLCFLRPNVMRGISGYRSTRTGWIRMKNRAGSFSGRLPGAPMTHGGPVKPTPGSG